MAAAAYRSGEKLTNEWDGITHDYTRKGGIVHSEILLPAHAPPAFQDRSTLWNSVEESEKSGKSQLAREIEIALPTELDRQAQLALVRAYVRDNFVSAGMCADFALHDKEDGNPHAHIMLTIRPLEQSGAWGAKCRKEYLTDQRGQRIPDGKGGWKNRRVDTTDWNDRGKAEQWRAAWAEYANRALERAGHRERIDHRSFQRQGVERLPTVHMGVAATRMERRGIATDKGNSNRQITADNKLLKEIKARMTRLYNWSKEQAAKPQGKESVMAQLWQARQETPQPSTRYGKVKALKENAALFHFLQANGIATMQELHQKIAAINGSYYDLRGDIRTTERRIATLTERLELWAQYEKFKGKRRGEAEKTLYHAAGQFFTELKATGEAITPKQWFIEGDIKGCFDNIDHHVLANVINAKIKDARLIKLIWKFLKAGYMEDWQYHATYSGCPQGGIVSPILANIYLNELDKFVEKTAKEFYKNRDRVHTAEYDRVAWQVSKAKKLLKTASGQKKTALMQRIEQLKVEMHKTPCMSKTDKVIKYIRYADDFIIGVKGGKVDCERIKQQLSDFIGQTLEMELSEQKTLITHSNQYARFLGYDIRVRRDQTLKPHGNHVSRTLNGSVELCVPFADKIMPFLFGKPVIRQLRDGTIEPIARRYIYRCMDLEIVSTYNSELRGICNYYSIASNFNKLQYFEYLMEYSCLKTLAGKHESTSKKIIRKYRDGNGGWGVSYQTKKGVKRRSFARFMDCKNTDLWTDKIINFAITHVGSRTTFEDRLSASVCELCGKTNVLLEVHHVNKVKNLKGKQLWELTMIAKKRKTLAVCKDCHHKIHHP